MSYISSTNLNFKGDISTYNLELKNYSIPAAERGEPHLIEGIEWLAIVNSLWRAGRIEGEIKPQADYIKYRNKCLEDAGNCLALASKQEAGLKKETDTYDPVRTGENRIIQEALDKYSQYSGRHYVLPGNPNRANYKEACQHLKTAIDLMDNDAQQDMMRLRSLLDKRDEAYSSSSEFMTKINQNIKMAISILAS